MAGLSEKPIGIGLLGFGTVGIGVAKLLERNRPLIESRIGARIKLQTALVKDLKKERETVPAGITLTDDPEKILGDPEIKIVIELMGGFEPARTYLLQAMKAGKHVVTANKAVLAKHW